MTLEDLLTDLQPMVESISTQFGRRTYKYGADNTDHAQELYAWLIENADRILEWRSEYEPEHFDRHMARCLANELRDYTRDIKAQALGYDRSDEHFYGKGEMTFLLDAVFDPEAWLHPPKSEGRTAKAPAEGNNWVTTLSDVSAGLKKLSVEDQVLLRSFHEEGRTTGEVADAYKVTESAMYKRHSRAIGRLVELLGGELPRPARPGSETDPWRGRHPVSNAQARAVQSSYYEEDQ